MLENVDEFLLCKPYASGFEHLWLVESLSVACIEHRLSSGRPGVLIDCRYFERILSSR